MLNPSFQECFDGSHMNCNLEYGITTEDYNKTKSLMQQPKHTKKSRLIFMEMSIDTPFRLWHQRAECHIFCQWDWAAARGLVANTIEECKHTEGHERPINASSLGLINYPKKETEVWGHQRNQIRTRFITQSLHPPFVPHAILSFLCLSSCSDFGTSCESVNNLLTSCRGQTDSCQSEPML